MRRVTVSKMLVNAVLIFLFINPVSYATYSVISSTANNSLSQMQIEEEFSDLELSLLQRAETRAKQSGELGLLEIRFSNLTNFSHVFKGGVAYEILKSGHASINSVLNERQKTKYWNQILKVIMGDFRFSKHIGTGDKAKLQREFLESLDVLLEEIRPSYKYKEIIDSIKSEFSINLYLVFKDRDRIDPNELIWEIQKIQNQIEQDKGNFKQGDVKKLGQKIAKIGWENERIADYEALLEISQILKRSSLLSLEFREIEFLDKLFTGFDARKHLKLSGSNRFTKFSILFKKMVTFKIGDFLGDDSVAQIYTAAQMEREEKRLQEEEEKRQKKLERKRKKKEEEKLRQQKKSFKGNNRVHEGDDKTAKTVEFKYPTQYLQEKQFVYEGVEDNPNMVAVFATKLLSEFFYEKNPNHLKEQNEEDKDKAEKVVEIPKKKKKKSSVVIGKIKGRMTYREFQQRILAGTAKELERFKKTSGGRLSSYYVKISVDELMGYQIPPEIYDLARNSNEKKLEIDFNVWLGVVATIFRRASEYPSISLYQHAVISQHLHNLKFVLGDFYRQYKENKLKGAIAGQEAWGKSKLYGQSEIRVKYKKVDEKIYKAMKTLHSELDLVHAAFSPNEEYIHDYLIQSDSYISAALEAVGYDYPVYEEFFMDLNGSLQKVMKRAKETEELEVLALGSIHNKLQAVENLLIETEDSDFATIASLIREGLDLQSYDEFKQWLAGNYNALYMIYVEELNQDVQVERRFAEGVLGLMNWSIPLYWSFVSDEPIIYDSIVGL